MQLVIVAFEANRYVNSLTILHQSQDVPWVKAFSRSRTHNSDVLFHRTDNLLLLSGIRDLNFAEYRASVKYFSVFCGCDLSRLLAQHLPFHGEQKYFIGVIWKRLARPQPCQQCDPKESQSNCIQVFSSHDWLAILMVRTAFLFFFVPINHLNQFLVSPQMIRHSGFQCQFGCDFKLRHNPIPLQWAYERLISLTGRLSHIFPGFAIGILFSVDPVTRLVTYSLDKLESPLDFGKFLDDVLAHPDYQAGYNLLGDVRQLTIVPTTEFVRSCVDLIVQRADRLGHCHWAVVVPSPALFGMTRMASILLDRTKIQLCAFLTSMAEARAWLNQPLEHSCPE